MPLCLGAAQCAGREKPRLVLHRGSGRSSFVTGSPVCPGELMNLLVTQLHVLRFATCTPKPPLQRHPLQRAPETPANKYLRLLETNGVSFLPKFRPKKERSFKVNVTLVKSHLMFRQLGNAEPTSLVPPTERETCPCSGLSWVNWQLCSPASE